MTVLLTAVLLSLQRVLTVVGLCHAAVMQVGSRIWVLWGVVNLAPRATTTQSVELFQVGQHAVQLNFMTLVVAWSLTEVVRYSFFAVKARRNDDAFPHAPTLAVDIERPWF